MLTWDDMCCTLKFERKRFVHGTDTVFTWDRYSLYMGQIWFVHVVYMGQMRFEHGTDIVCTWDGYGLYMERICFVHWTGTVCTWDDEYGLYIGRVWFVHADGNVLFMELILNVQEPCMRMICKGTGMRCTRDGYNVYKDRVYIVQGTDMICTRTRYVLFKGRI